MRPCDLTQQSVLYVPEAAYLINLSLIISTLKNMTDSRLTELIHVSSCTQHRLCVLLVCLWGNQPFSNQDEIITSSGEGLFRLL